MSITYLILLGISVSCLVAASKTDSMTAWQRERRHLRKSRVTYVWPRINP